MTRQDALNYIRDKELIGPISFFTDNTHIPYALVVTQSGERCTEWR